MNEEVREFGNIGNEKKKEMIISELLEIGLDI